MISTIYKSKKVNSITVVTVLIEETYMNNFSILCYDDPGDVWVEKFADTLENAQKVADKLFSNICKQF
jgi:hypothetical protein